MAVVYLARQPDLDRHVALKELNALHADDPSQAQRFLQESRLAGSLAHANIVTVHDYFVHDGTPFIAMEYLRRGSLRPHVGQLTLAQIAGVLEGLLAGLAHAEEHEIVHRDIKPENLMISGDGRVKIADFGIAKATNSVQGAAMLTATGMAVGTPNYMAPEQAMAVEVGPWTDLYSVGCMAYELFVGSVPFDDGDPNVAVAVRQMAILTRRIEARPPSARTLNPAVDADVSHWVDRLLIPDPRLRTQTAREAWEEFEEIIISQLGARWRRAAALPALPPPQASATTVTPADSISTPARPDVTPHADAPRDNPVPGPYTPPPRDVSPASPEGERLASLERSMDAEPAVTDAEAQRASNQSTGDDPGTPVAPADHAAPRAPASGEYVTFGAWEKSALPADTEPVDIEGDPDGSESADSPPEARPDDPASAPEPPPSTRRASSAGGPEGVVRADFAATLPPTPRTPSATATGDARGAGRTLVLSALAGGMVGMAALGFLLAPQHTTSIPLRADQPLGVERLDVSVPSTWRSSDVTADLKIPGLDLRGARAAQPRRHVAGQGVVAGLASSTLPSLLPPAFGELLERSPSRQPVRLASGVIAYRYSGLDTRSSGAPLTVYAIPTAAGIATLVCRGPAGSEVADACDAVAGTMRPQSQAFSPPPRAVFIEAVNQATARLDDRERSARKDLGNARTPRRLARVLAKLATAYNAADNQVRSITAAPFEIHARREIAGQLAELHRTYEQLSDASRHQKRARYRRLRQHAYGARKTLRSKLIALRSLVHDATIANRGS